MDTPRLPRDTAGQQRPRRPRKRRLVDLSIRHEDAGTELSKAKAALWLLGELWHGELCFLENIYEAETTYGIVDQRDPDFRMSGRELSGWIEDMCLRSLAEALKGAEADVAELRAKAAAPKLEALGKETA